MPGCEKQRISANNFGWHLELDKRYVCSVLDKSGMRQARSAVTPESKEAMATAENAEKKFISVTRTVIETIAHWLDGVSV